MWLIWYWKTIFRPFDPQYYEDEFADEKVLDEEERTRLKIKVPVHLNPFFFVSFSFYKIQCRHTNLRLELMKWSFMQGIKRLFRIFLGEKVYHLLFKMFLLILEREEGAGGRERGRERNRNTDLLFHFFIHWLVGCCLCPDQGSNPQPWRMGTML